MEWLLGITSSVFVFFMCLCIRKRERDKYSGHRSNTTTEREMSTRGKYVCTDELFILATDWMSENYSYVPYMEPARDGFIAGYNALELELASTKKMLDEALIVTKKCADDYWFMINLLEKYSSNKEEALNDVLERMKFRLPMFKALAKHEKKGRV